MPSLEPLLEDNEHLEELKLWLPSELSQDDRVAWCLPGIPELKFHFRYAQAVEQAQSIFYTRHSTLILPSNKRGGGC